LPGHSIGREDAHTNAEQIFGYAAEEIVPGTLGC
jgi:hypothetical protein